MDQLAPKTNRVILHADLNAFYASVECLYRPELRRVPVAVCGDAQKRHGIVLAKNEPAKACGIQTGEAIWQAQNKCPGLKVLTADYRKYIRYACRARDLFAQYSEQVEPFGLDEAWIDVTGSQTLFGDGVQMANQLRRRMRDELGLTCSVGLSFNKVFAKLGSDLNKPDATTVLTAERYRETIWPLPVNLLIYAGPATCRALRRVGIRTIGDLACLTCRQARSLLGKWGETLWFYAQGLDDSPVRPLAIRDMIQSVGHSTTTPRDLYTDEEVRLVLTVLAESVATRLREQGLRCRTLQLSVRDDQLMTIERQCVLAQPTDLARDVIRQAMGLFQTHWPWRRPVRSLGVRACRLETADHGIQLTLFDDPDSYRRWKELESTLDGLRSRFGHKSVRRGLLLKSPDLSELNPRTDHIIHPSAYRRP